MKRFIYLILFFLIFSFNTSIAQEGLQQVRISDFSGGMDSNNLADFLSPNVGAKASNVSINRIGRITKRRGQSLFAEDVGSTAFTGLDRFDPDPSTSYIIAASGVDIVRALSSETSYTVTNPNDSLSSGQDTEFVQANDLLFILNGQDNTSWYDGSAFEIGLGFASGSPPTGTTASWLRNYLFISGNPVDEDFVYFSNNLQPKVFTATDLFRVNTGDGQKVQKIEPFKLNELIIYKERSIYVLDITGATPLDDWTVQPITRAVGCVAPRSVINLGNDQWFLSSNPIAVRSLVRSTFDKILVNIVSDPIQDIFDRKGEIVINNSQIDKSAAVLFDNKYILAIPTGTSNVNNTVVIFDFIVNGWFLIEGWFPRDWIVFDKRLFYTDANDGRIIEVFTGTTGDYAKGPTTLSVASPPTVVISFEWTSRSISFEKPEIFKKLDSIEVEFGTTGNYDANLWINLDQDGWQNVGTVNLAGGVLTLPFTLPATLKSAGIARKTFQLQRYGEFKKMQIRISQGGATGQEVDFQRGTIFARPKPWRRE